MAVIPRVKESISRGQEERASKMSYSEQRQNKLKPGDLLGNYILRHLRLLDQELKNKFVIGRKLV